MKSYKEPLRGFVVKLKPTEEQIKIFYDYANASRFIYNTFLGYQNKAFDNFKKWSELPNNKDKTAKQYYQETGLKSYYSSNDLSKLLFKYKDSVSWLSELNLNTQSLKEPIRDLDQAFQNYFNSCNGTRKGKPVKHPTFKKKFKTAPKFTIIYSSSTAKPIKDNSLYFPSIGKVNCYQFDSIPRKCKSKYTLKSITVKLDSDGDWYASFNYVDMILNSDLLPKTGNKCGIDFGIKKFITLHDGTNNEIIDLPRKQLIKLENKIKVLQSKLSRKLRMAKLQAKQYGLDNFYYSNNMKQLKAKIAKLHNKIKNVRKNAQHVISYNLIKTYDTIVIEDLNIAGMLQNRRIAKAVSRYSWNQFTTFLKYKAELHDKSIVMVDRFFPSSKTCSDCGTINSNLKMQKTWTCPSCGANHDRDYNAAINLYKLA